MDSNQHDASKRKWNWNLYNLQSTETTWNEGNRTDIFKGTTEKTCIVHTGRKSKFRSSLLVNLAMRFSFKFYMTELIVSITFFYTSQNSTTSSITRLIWPIILSLEQACSVSEISCCTGRLSKHYVTLDSSKCHHQAEIGNNFSQLLWNIRGHKIISYKSFCKNCS